MQKPAKILLGIATLLPWAYGAYFISSLFKFLDANTIEESDAIFQQLLVPHIGTMILTLVLLIVLIAHVMKNKTFTDMQKLIWVILIVFGNLVAMPIYWFLHIWRTPGPNKISE